MGFRSAATNATAATSLSISAPAGAASGDVLIAYILSDEGGNTLAAVEGGWTPGPADNSADVSFALFTRELSASPPASYGFTAESGIVGGIIAINPDGGTSPVVANGGIESLESDTATTPALATVANPRTFIGIYACDSGFTVATPPSGMTTAHALINASGISVALAAYYEENPTDISTISRVLVWSGSEALRSIGYLVSFTAGGGGAPRFAAFQRMMQLNN